MAEAAIQTICVIIAAKNAADTIGLAVESALREDMVSEVVVVDDGSSDGTDKAALASDDGSGRIKIISFERNRGPSAARNAAIAQSTAPLIAILDADDFFFPGRFAPMLAETDWDFIADNIAFVADPAALSSPARFQSRARTMSLVQFVEGNISRRGKPRGETGFLKPIMRREFIVGNGLVYDEELRLGEDYDFYVRALALGARYKVIEHCGYGAVVRGDSLSSRHRTEDLRRLFEADNAILSQSSLSADARAVITQHRDHIRDRYELRAFLDVKREAGKGGAIRHMLSRPGAIPAVALGIFHDKYDALRRSDAASAASLPTSPRYLLAGVPVGGS
ncbi:glycosyltransferase family 2 protein [Neorhizobium sp. NCHU2750]|uniref:glycosyltransferase family 2 protein n=1 Tax=Neorhizobium sp. NCHU2750 TaxID=1825976 RepID=UPI000E738F44|nr:succinoglycan biosynthesis protein [Neorhizobium sp. NCHU2750]